MLTRTDFLKPFRFATIGFSITVLFVAYQLLANLDLFSLREFLPMVVVAILCPPSLVSSRMIDAEVGTHAFYVLWTMIAILNAALYFLVAAMLRAVRKRA
ncbi:MAG TPA: hypothetical protein VF123_01250 [Candidatus Sulfotelmatobacter sp.]